MKKKDYIILMADIVDSRKAPQKKLMKTFQKITNDINYEKSDVLLSPITITLGDEFQCIVKSVEAGVDIMIALDEKRIQQQADFKLRYVLSEGIVDTPINQRIAYGMLGDGLTKARETLTNSKSAPHRYMFDLRNKEKSEALANSMLIYQSITDGWDVEKDYPLINMFIQLEDYKLVATEMGKNRSQTWKREKNLKMDAYSSIKKVVHYIAGNQ